MDAFQGRSCFAGPSIGASGSLLSQAHFNGCVAFTSWLREDVERFLPPEIELAVNTSSTPQAHPVVFIFGELIDGGMIFGGVTIPLGVRYREVAITVPFVTHKGGRYLHTYVPRMYSSYFPATWVGNIHFGFSKETAKMWWQGRVFMLTTEDDGLLLHASVETDGDWSSGLRCELPNFQAMREVFALPLIGRKADGTYVCSYFGWDFSEARVRSADSCVSIDAPLVEGLTPRRCYDVPSGTFEVQGMLWKLSWPSSCQFR